MQLTNVFLMTPKPADFNLQSTRGLNEVLPLGLLENNHSLVEITMIGKESLTFWRGSLFFYHLARGLAFQILLVPILTIQVWKFQTI